MEGSLGLGSAVFFPPRRKIFSVCFLLLQHCSLLPSWIFYFHSQYNINLEGVFDGNIDQRDEIGGIFFRLKKLLVFELHTSWDIAYLEQYVIQKMVPRSLRWEVSPQKGETELEG